MNNITKNIQRARPKLKLVSPLAYSTVLIMAIFNVVLGLSFLFTIDDSRLAASLLIVNDIFTFKFWGIVFILIGLLKLFALWSNNWNLARKTLFIGVSVKAAWMVALIIRVFTHSGTIFLTLLWITVALLQMASYIWFFPPANAEPKDIKLDKK